MVFLHQTLTITTAHHDSELADCDPALLRRFAVRVLVGLPSHRDRRKIIRRLLRDVQHGIVRRQMDQLAAMTEGWSGSDIESVTREAAMAPVRECLRAAAVRKRSSSGIEAHSAARESLLNSFRNLRPVSFQDFVVSGGAFLLA